MGSLRPRNRPIRPKCPGRERWDGWDTWDGCPDATAGPADDLRCLLAAYVRWHLEAAWAPLLYRDETPPARTDPVGPPGRSAGAIAKEHAHRTPDGLPVGSLPDTPRRTRHAHPQPGRAAGGGRTGGVRGPERPHSAPGPRPRADRGLARLDVVRTAQPHKPHPRSDLPVDRWKFGLARNGAGAKRRTAQRSVS